MRFIVDYLASRSDHQPVCHLRKLVYMYDISNFWDPERKLNMVDVWLSCVGMWGDFQDNDSPEGFRDAPTHLFWFSQIKSLKPCKSHLWIYQNWRFQQLVSTTSTRMWSDHSFSKQVCLKTATRPLLLRYTKNSRWYIYTYIYYTTSFCGSTILDSSLCPLLFGDLSTENPYSTTSIH